MLLQKFDILPKVQFKLKTLNSTSVFSLKCQRVTNYASSSTRSYSRPICFKWRTRLIENATSRVK